jgi:hypothetical protein
VVNSGTNHSGKKKPIIVNITRGSKAEALTLNKEHQILTMHDDRWIRKASVQIQRTHLPHLEGGGGVNECGDLFPKTSLLHKNSLVNIQHFLITHCCHL